VRIWFSDLEYNTKRELLQGDICTNRIYFLKIFTDSETFVPPAGDRLLGEGAFPLGWGRGKVFRGPVYSELIGPFRILMLSQIFRV
jgi:hypothetical protein